MPKRRKVMVPRGGIQQKAEWSGSRGSYLTRIPNLARDTMEEIEVMPIREPFTYARILYDHDRSEYIYEVWEPHLDAREKEFLDMIKDSLNRTLEYEWEKMAEKDKKEYIEEAVDSFIRSRGIRLEPASKDKIVYYIIRDFVGYGPVDVLMADLRIEDVSCDGTGIPLFVFHQKYESIKTNVIFDDDDALNSFVVLLGQRCAKQISVANPILDGTSFEGHRVQATYAREVTTRGSSFTIRRYKEKPFTPVELVKFGTASAEMVAYLWVAVESGKSMMVCGGTASGKTATLNSAALFIRPAPRSCRSRTRGRSTCPTRTGSPARPGPGWASAGPTERPAAKSTCTTSCGPRCGNGRTTSSSGKCAARRRTRCSKRWPRATQRCPRCTRIPSSRWSTGWRTRRSTRRESCSPP